MLKGLQFLSAVFAQMMIDLWFFFLYLVWDLATIRELPFSFLLLCPAMGRPRLGWIAGPKSSAAL